MTFSPPGIKIQHAGAVSVPSRLQVKLKRRLEEQAGVCMPLESFSRPQAKDAHETYSAKQQQLERQRQHAFLKVGRDSQIASQGGRRRVRGSAA